MSPLPPVCVLSLSLSYQDGRRGGAGGGLVVCVSPRVCAACLVVALSPCVVKTGVQIVACVVVGDLRCGWIVVLLLSHVLCRDGGLGISLLFPC